MCFARLIAIGDCWLKVYEDDNEDDNDNDNEDDNEDENEDERHG